MVGLMPAAAAALRTLLSTRRCTTFWRIVFSLGAKRDIWTRFIFRIICGTLLAHTKSYTTIANYILVFWAINYNPPPFGVQCASRPRRTQEYKEKREKVRQMEKPEFTWHIYSRAGWKSQQERTGERAALVF